MDVCLLCLYVVLYRVGRGLFDGLITRPGESYRVSNCVIKRTTVCGRRENSAVSKFLIIKKNMYHTAPQKLAQTGRLQFDPDIDVWILLFAIQQLYQEG
jgi:hypothetical protein